MKFFQIDKKIKIVCPGGQAKGKTNDFLDPRSKHPGFLLPPEGKAQGRKKYF